MSITKTGETEECSYYYPTADWGCYHGGDAMIGKYYDYAWFNRPEEAEIRDVRNGTYNIEVMHYYSDYETYYSEDNKEPASLNIMIGGVKIGSFKHDVNGDTHTNGVENPNYTGGMVVSVTCDSSCKCQAAKQVL